MTKEKKAKIKSDTTSGRSFKEPPEPLTLTLLARPTIVDEWLEIDSEIKKLSKRKEEIRPDLMGHLMSLEEKYPDIYWKRNGGKKLNYHDPGLLYDYLASVLPPEVLEEVTITTTTRVINEDLLDDLYVKGYIDSIPESCYSITKTTDAIEVPANRQRKPKE